VKTHKTRNREKRQLVLQHLESISWRILEDSPELVKKMTRRRSGVYALYRKDKLYYVGLASNLMGRLRSHLKDRHHGVWDRFSVYLTVRDEHIKEIESLLLRITSPPGNKQKGKFVASENLLFMLNKLMKEADADRRARLLGGYIARRRRRAKTAKGRGTMVLAGVVERRYPLIGRWKTRRHHATLRTDGLISFNRKTYESPSAAACAATGRACNGWHFWSYKDERGRWVPLSTLRR
jgi:hypothetical protein